MPIYEYYCRENNTLYQFFAKTLAQGSRVPRCPDNPTFSMEKVMSAFAITGPSSATEAPEGGTDAQPAAEDPRMDAAMSVMEQEFSSVDENDPRAMGRMMRRMAEISGEPIDGEMEEVVRKLEEGVDPERLEEQLGGTDPAGESEGMDDGYGGSPESMQGLGEESKEARFHYKQRRAEPFRDPKLYDYET